MNEQLIHNLQKVVRSYDILKGQAERVADKYDNPATIVHDLVISDNGMVTAYYHYTRQGDFNNNALTFPAEWLYLSDETLDEAITIRKEKENSNQMRL